jgi:hypothetical protein
MEYSLAISPGSGGWMASKPPFRGPSLSSSSRNWLPPKSFHMRHVRKIAKATVSFVMSVRPSVRAHATARLPLDGVLRTYIVCLVIFWGNQETRALVFVKYVWRNCDYTHSRIVCNRWLATERSYANPLCLYDLSVYEMWYAISTGLLLVDEECMTDLLFKFVRICHQAAGHINLTWNLIEIKRRFTLKFYSGI